MIVKCRYCKNDCEKERQMKEDNGEASCLKCKKIKASIYYRTYMQKKL